MLNTSVPCDTSAERVAVGRRARRLGGGDRAAGAGLVVDHDGLAERLAELLGEDARRRCRAVAPGASGTIRRIGLARPRVGAAPRPARASESRAAACVVS